MNDKKSTSDEEEDDESLSDNIETPTNFLSSIENSKNFMSTSNYSSTVEFNHIQESFVRNVVLVDDPLTDVKRLISRYDIFNLFSNTTLTGKRQSSQFITCIRFEFLSDRFL